MSTVLTKPVLLDETGQAIVEKLTDIQQAIGGTGEFVPIGIRVTTPPTKTNYLAGEALDLSGMVVTLVASNGGMYDITGDCVFSPADGSTVTSSTTEVNISYTWYKDSTVFTAKQPLSIKELASIAVTTPPTVTEYTVGDTLDLTGIVVTATFVDGTTSVVTNDCVFSPDDGATLAVSDTTINISLTMGTVTKTTTQMITVSAIIYGVEWDGSADPTFTRTDMAADFPDPVPYHSSMTGSPSSPFDNISPWKDMEIVEDAQAGTLVKIPKFYYKWTRNGNAMKLQISNTQFEGAHISPAHADRGDGQGERDIVYVGRYTCVSGYKSGTGASLVSTPLASFRSGISALGSDVWQMDFAMLWTIRMLYLVEFATWKSKLAGSKSYDNGDTDNLPYHTGYRNKAQYRHIEGVPAGSKNHFLANVYIDNNEIYIIKNPSDFGDMTKKVKIADCPTAGVSGWGVASHWTAPTEPGLEYAMIPDDRAAGSSSDVFNTYCACSYDNFSGMAAIGGFTGSYGNELFNSNGIASSAMNSGANGMTSRVMKLPNNT